MNENNTPPNFSESHNRAGQFDARQAKLALAAALLAGVFLVLDVGLPFAALAGMPYSILVVLGWFAESWYFTLTATAAATVLTVVGHLLSPEGGDPGNDIANRAIALVAIWFTAALLFQAKRQMAAGLRGDPGLDRDMGGDPAELELMRSAQRRLERLAAMGEKAGTTAHELRNPLGVIATSMSVIEFKARKAGLDLTAALDRANRAVRRCEHIIDEHLDAARARGHRPEPVVIDIWLSSLLDELDFSKDISVGTDFQARGLVVEIDADSFRRVLINLVDNAIQALSETSHDRVMTVGSRAEDGAVEIFVADNGPGITPNLLAHVTEALFSTKPYGTGLGLPTVQRIIDEHGGAMTIESEPGRGTQVNLRLPASGRE